MLKLLQGTPIFIWIILIILLVFGVYIIKMIFDLVKEKRDENTPLDK